MKNQSFKMRTKSPGGQYSLAFKKRIVQEYLSGGPTQEELRKKHGIKGHSTILYWCRQYGNLQYIETFGRGRAMKDPQQQRIKELEKRLKQAELKVLAYETLIEVIKEEDGIDLLKKDAAKQ